ncbi:MAG: type II toxin-antitoxin system PemK/MazF family toxin [Candidatus Dormibacteraeota bacterium]|nr:type II toxin-antitoxin system PemK/MazF family toxin [Candidatus Dormibacteraeota bacterium]
MRKDDGAVAMLLHDVRQAVDRALAARWPPDRAATWPAGPATARRGQVWLAARPETRRLRPVLVVQRNGTFDESSTVLVAPLGRLQAGASSPVVDESDGLPVPASVRLDRVFAVELDDLELPVTTVSAARMAVIDQALAALIGVASDSPIPVADTPAEFPPPPPPAAAVTKPRDLTPQTSPWTGEATSGRLEDHPMARIFGMSPPPRGSGLPSAPASDPGGVPIAALLPELQDISRQRLRRSSTRIEAVLTEGAAAGRSVQWAADTVRATPIRGVLQSTLDEIAAAMLDLAASSGRPV